MKLRKIFNYKRGIVIVGVLLSTLAVLTGCSQADITIKTYEKENEVQVGDNKSLTNQQAENQTKNETTGTQTTNEEPKSEKANQLNQKYAEANRAIKNALSDIKWLENNGMYFVLDMGDMNPYATKVYFTQLKDNDEGMPVYLIITQYIGGDSFHAKVVSYKNGSVHVSQKSAGSDYTDIFVDYQNNLVKTINMSAGYVHIYKVENGEIIEVREFENEDDSLGEYPEGNFKQEKIELSSYNLSKYIYND